MMKKAVGLLLPVLIFFTFYVARAQSLFKLTVLLLMTGVLRITAQDTAVAFTGEKTAWHEGFDRYDFLMDEQTFALTPIRA
jgi:hypothetical protein